MKVNFNQTITNNYQYKPVNKLKESALYSTPRNADNYPVQLSPANFPNISFRGHCGINDAQFLIGCNSYLKCAYSRKPMLHPVDAKGIFQKLQKKPNAESAVRYLSQYKNFMHPIEEAVFDLFNESEGKNKRDFKNILREHRDDALERLQQKQIEILISTDEFINAMSPRVSKEAGEIRDRAIDKMYDNTFGRKIPLDMLKKIKASGEDLDLVDWVYRVWYNLPSSSKDFDAFVVQYSKRSHNEIAHRILSSSVATIEHIRPQSRNGQDMLGNYLLVSSDYNSIRQSMRLDRYIQLTNDVDIVSNLQKYLDDIIRSINNKRPMFLHRTYYPEAIKDTIAKETFNTVVLNTNALRLSPKQIEENKYALKLGEKFRLM